MNNNRGFTLLEMAIVVAIFGIMAALAVVKYNDAVANSELDKAANDLYLELRSLRSLSFKYDSWVMANFTESQCNIYVDTNENKTQDAEDIRKVHNIPSPVTIGLSSDPPTSWPYGDDWDDGDPPTNGKAENWKTELTVEPDSRGEYCHGGIYLKSPRLSKITYCIGITTEMQSLELFKWNGTSWQKR
ncbi:MAG: type II secretion system protein [Chitinispirillaceae bacterium]|nr:type II secretion system protein [Chitinispirillaceae bacterium]